MRHHNIGVEASINTGKTVSVGVTNMQAINRKQSANWVQNLFWLLSVFMMMLVGWSVEAVAAVTVPGAPTIGTATAGNAQATVTFTAPTSNGGATITGYTVTSSPAGGVDSNAGTTGVSHVITGLTNGTAYTFTVKATNSAGSSTASAASNSVTPATVPGAPTIGTATGGNTQATVTFTAPTSNGGSAITGYTVTSSPTGGVDSNAGTTGLSHVMTGLTNGTAYKFTVKATNAKGSSSASSASNSVTPATVPGAPIIGTATSGNAQATVTFTAPTSNGGSAITGYTVTSSPAGGVDSNAGTTGLSHVMTGLTNGTVYTFTVKATNAKGTGAASTASSSVTPTATVTVPGAPTIGTATGGNAQATVTFTAPASNGGATITGYTVTSSPAGGVDSNAGTTGLSHVMTGLTNGTAYTFTVKATNSAGAGAASSASNSVTPVAPVTVPGAPTIGTATAGNAQATVTFTAPASNGGATITGYTVTSSPAGGVDSNAGTTGLNHVMTGLINGTAYTFTVKATNSAGSGATSVASNNVTPSAPPAVSMTSPVANAMVIAPASFTLTASAASVGSTIKNVAFYNGATLIATVSASPYTVVWSNVASGSYTLTAIATDNNGVATTSAPVTVIANTPPTVSVSAPLANTSYAVSSSVTLSANASDSDGTISKVDFYANNGTNTLIGTVTAAPYSLTWNATSAGNYTITAVATDNRGTQTASASTAISVIAAPSVSLTSPANNAVVAAPGSFTIAANASSAGTIAKVDFYSGTTLLGTVSTAPYSFTWSNVTAGSYIVTAKATDTLGNVTTSPAITVIADALPVVSLTSPASGAQMVAPGSFTLTASATSVASTIVKVDFYNGATLLGTATAAPYSFTWSNVPIGSYSLTAIATDALGISASSTAVAVNSVVNQPPSVTLTSPTDGASVKAPASLIFTASAISTTSSVARVDYYSGTTLIGSATAAPYSFTWSNVALGTYSLTAVATDVMNAQTTSAPVLVTVNDGTLQTYYIHADQLDTPREITDTNGTLVWQWDNNDPFGVNAPNENPSGVGAFSFNLRFPGQYFDRETSTHYNINRDYDPATGRYIEADPLGVKTTNFDMTTAGLNHQYTYAFNSPMQFTDPKGLWPYHGFWCGPNWTGGKKEIYDPAHANQYHAPIDELDTACQTHDICYSSCRKSSPCDQKKRAQCMTACDRQLANNSKGAGYWHDSPLWEWMENNNAPDPGSNKDCGCGK
jgi:RHS repeat-associated protein